MSKVVKSARGQMVDFDLLKIKQDLLTHTTVVVDDKGKIPGKRKRISSKAASVVSEVVAAEKAAQAEQNAPEAPTEESAAQPETADEAAPKIIRRKK